MWGSGKHNGRYIKCSLAVLDNGQPLYGDGLYKIFQRFLKETISKEDIPISEPNQNLFQNFYNYIMQIKIKANSTSLAKNYLGLLKL